MDAAEYTIPHSDRIKIFNREDSGLDDRIKPKNVDKSSILDSLDTLLEYKLYNNLPTSGMLIMHRLLPKKEILDSVQPPFQLTNIELSQVVESLDQIVSTTQPKPGTQEYLQLQQVLKSKDVWSILARFDMLLENSNGGAFMKDLPEKGLSYIDFLQWIQNDPLSADLLTRDIGWFHKEKDILERMNRDGFTTALGAGIRKDVFAESKRIAKVIIKDTGQIVSPLLLTSLQDVIKGVANQDEILRRTQLVSLDRGGRLLTRALLTNEPFNRLLTEYPSTAYRGVKIDTEELSKQLEPVDAFDPINIERVKSILQSNPQKDIMLLLDLNGGVTKTRKQHALHHLFGELTEEQKHIFTGGNSSFNDITLPMSSLTALDRGCADRTFGESTVLGNYFIKISPPFPWNLALHANGDERLSEAIS